MQKHVFAWKWKNFSEIVHDAYALLFEFEKMSGEKQLIDPRRKFTKIWGRVNHNLYEGVGEILDFLVIAEVKPFGDLAAYFSKYPT